MMAMYADRLLAAMVHCLRMAFMALGIALAALLATSCGRSPTAPGGTTTFAFDFSQGVQGWQAGLADYAIGSSEADSFPAPDYLPLPAPLDTTKSALFLSSTNTQSEGGPFMFEKRLISGLAPSHTYGVSIALELALIMPIGCGPGGCPGDDVYVEEALESVTEPAMYADGTIQRIRLNKGDGPTSGTAGHRARRHLERPSVQPNPRGQPGVDTQDAARRDRVADNGLDENRLADLRNGFGVPGTDVSVFHEILGHVHTLIERSTSSTLSTFPSPSPTSRAPRPPRFHPPAHFTCSTPSTLGPSTPSTFAPPSGAGYHETGLACVH